MTTKYKRHKLVNYLGLIVIMAIFYTNLFKTTFDQGIKCFCFSDIPVINDLHWHSFV